MRWATYVITAVGYDGSGKQIVEVEVREDLDTTLDAPSVWRRQSVIQAIRNGFTFVTAFERAGSWHRGAKVEIVRVGFEEFLRTDANQERADNLGELPVLSGHHRPSARW